MTLTANNDNTKYDKALRMAEVCNIVGLSEATIYRYVSSGAFPRPAKLFPGGASRWSRNAVLAWWEERQHPKSA